MTAPPFVLREDPRRLAEHWCDELPPGNGLIDGVTIMMRGLMQPPRLELRRDAIELFPDCPALALPRRLLSRESQALLNELELQEVTALRANPPAHGRFRGRTTMPDGDFRFFAFEGDDLIGDAFDPSAWMEALARALFDGGGDFKYEIGEACRGALINALALEPAPRVPPNVLAVQSECIDAFETDFSRASPEPRASWPEAPASRPIGARFLKAIPKPEFPSAPSAAIDRFARTEALEARLREAQALEKAYLRACDLRRFARGLIDRVAQWR